MTGKTALEIYTELVNVHKALEHLYRDYPIRSKEWGKPLGSRHQYPSEIAAEMKRLEGEEARIRQAYKAALARSTP